MGIFDFLSNLNPFGSSFEDVKKFEGDIEDQLNNNSVGYSEEYDTPITGILDKRPDDYSPGGAGNDSFNSFSYTPTTVDFTSMYENKKQKINKYREMSFYPEVQNALDIYCDEAIVFDAENKVARLEVSKELPTDVERILHKEFEYVMNVVFKAKTNKIYNMFRKFLIEGELFTEYVMDRNSKGLVGVQTLPVFTTFPVYDSRGNVTGFLHNKYIKGRETTIPMSNKQVGYINWGTYGNSVLDVRGYLEPSIRPYNQLKHLEDSLIIYRLVRAPERRMWNIEVGKTPPSKAAEFIKSVIHQYQRRMNYDETTGRVDSSKAVQSMSEDYWFTKREGVGSDVQVLQSGMNLGELEDVKYFLSKLFKSLKLPVTRWDPNLIGSSYQSGKQIEREELKFTLYVDRMKNIFKNIILEAYVTHIRLKYGEFPNFTKWIKDANIFDVKMTPSNHFKEFKDMELMVDKINLLKDLMDLSVDPMDENTKSRPFSRKYILTHPKMFGMTDSDMLENEQMKKEELMNMDKTATQPGSTDDQFGGEGGDMEGGEGMPPMGDDDMGGGQEPDMGGGEDISAPDSNQSDEVQQAGYVIDKPVLSESFAKYIKQKPLET